MSIRLRTCLIVLFTLLVIILSTVLSLIISNKSSQKVADEIGRSLAGTAYQMSDKLDHFMWSRAGEVDLLSTMDEFHDVSRPEGAQRLLNQLKSSFPSFSWVGYTNAEGKVVASTDGILLGSDIKARPVYQEGIKGKFIGDVHEAVLLAKLLPNPTGEPLQFVDISLPVKDSGGKVLGVLAAHLSWEWSKEVERTILTPQKGYNKDMELFIVSKTDGTVLLGPKHMVGQPLLLDSVTRAHKEKSGWELARWPDGKSYLTGFAYGDGYLNYPGLGWTVLVRQPEATALAAVSELRHFILIVGVVAVFLFALIGWVLAERITKPIRAIAQAADRLRAGASVELPGHKGFTEIEILSNSLKNLVDSLVRTESALGTMHVLAHNDQLTGLPNRTALEVYLEEAFERAERTEGALAFLYLDLDGFKKVNDTLGHHIGDILLQKAAKRLLESARPDSITVRLGGDEFLIVLQTTKGEAYAQAKEAAEEIIASLGRTFVIEYNKVNIGCSIGGALYPEHSDDPGQILKLADEALYRSKRAGRNCCTFQGEEE